MFTDNYVGGTGDSKKGYCITTGQFKDWTIGYPNAHCIKRNFADRNVKIPSFESPIIIENITYYKDFSNFSFDFEVSHGYVHTGIGGKYGDMTWEKRRQKKMMVICMLNFGNHLGYHLEEGTHRM